MEVRAYLSPAAREATGKLTSHDSGIRGARLDHPPAAQEATARLTASRSVCFSSCRFNSISLRIIYYLGHMWEKFLSSGQV